MISFRNQKIFFIGVLSKVKKFEKMVKGFVWFCIAFSMFFELFVGMDFGTDRSLLKGAIFVNSLDILAYFKHFGPKSSTIHQLNFSLLQIANYLNDSDAA